MMKLKMIGIGAFLLFSISIFSKSNPPDRTQLARQILQELYQVRGDFRYPAPAIQLAQTNVHIASYNPTRNTIVVEEKAFAVCESLGTNAENALAFLISHELEHFYQRMSDKTNFMAYDQPAYTSRRIEQEADLKGAFNAYLAGYQMQGAIPTLLDKLYDQYGLKDQKLDGYPDFRIRIRTAQQMEEKLVELIRIFEYSNYLSALGQYDLAANAYEHLLTYYTGVEFWNNCGLAFMLEALNLSEQNADAFLYPMELDNETRMQKPPARDGAKDLPMEEQIKRQVALAKADRCFQQIRRINPEYPQARMNALTLHVLRGNYREAVQEYQGQNLAQRLPSTMGAKAQIVLAIAYAYLGQEPEAREILQSLTGHPDLAISHIARTNAQILESKNAPNPVMTDCQSISFNPDLSFFPQSKPLVLQMNTESGPAFHYQRVGKKEEIIHVTNGDQTLFRFRRIGDNPSLAGTHLHIGQSLPEVLRELKDQSAITITSHFGLFLLYKNCRLLLWIDPSERLGEVVTFGN